MLQAIRILVQHAGYAKARSAPIADQAIWWKPWKELKPVNIFAFSGMDERWKNDISVFGPNFDLVDGGWGLWDAVRSPNYALCGKRRTPKCNRDVYAGAGYFRKPQVVDPSVEVIPNRRWRGALFVNGLFDQVFPIGLLRAEFKAPEAGQGKLALSPLFDPAPLGGLDFGSFLYAEDRELLPGQVVTFSGTCLRDELPDGPYSVRAEIVAFTSSFQFLDNQTVELRGNCDHQTFTVSLDTTNLPDVEIIFQYGFFLEGPATNQEGSIFIQVEDDGFPFDEHVGFMSDDD